MQKTDLLLVCIFLGSVAVFFWKVLDPEKEDEEDSAVVVTDDRNKTQKKLKDDDDEEQDEDMEVTDFPSSVVSHSLQM